MGEVVRRVERVTCSLQPFSNQVVASFGHLFSRKGRRLAPSVLLAVRQVDAVLLNAGVQWIDASPRTVPVVLAEDQRAEVRV